MSSAVDSSCPPSSSTSHRRSPSRSRSLRRQNKLLIEKKRRARINECLVQLKRFLVKDMGEQSSRTSNKLEKADILEMTVDYIKKMADKKPKASDLNQWLLDKFRQYRRPFQEGFSRCMEEADDFLNNQVMVKPEFRHKLLSHCRQQLNSKDTSLDETSRSTFSRSTSPEEVHDTVLKSVACHDTSQSFDEDSKVSQVSRLEDDNTSDRTSESNTAGSPVPASCHADNNTSNCRSESHTAGGPAFVALVQQAASQVSSTFPGAGITSIADNGIKFDAPLKLICGGNVFIVVDQQQNNKPEDTFDTCTSPSVLTTGQLLLNPSWHYGATSATCESVPQVSVSHSAVVPVSTISVETGKPSVGCLTFHEHKVKLDVHSPSSIDSHGPSRQDDNGQRKLEMYSSQNEGTQSGMPGPVCPHSPEGSRQAGNDINNNEVNLIGQASAVWRPW